MFRAAAGTSIHQRSSAAACSIWGRWDGKTKPLLIAVVMQMAGRMTTVHAQPAPGYHCLQPVPCNPGFGGTITATCGADGTWSFAGTCTVVSVELATLLPGHVVVL
jgi:hypothetical protein